MSLTSNAFKALVNFHGKNLQMKIYAAGATPGTTTMPVAPSNFYRKLEEPASITGKGREFVVIADLAEAILTRPPKKGDRLESARLGVLVIDECKEMFDVGGTVMGYRIRTQT